MGCYEINGRKCPTFYKISPRKDGLDIYNYQNYNKIFFELDKFICPLCNDEIPENEVFKIKSLKETVLILPFS